MQRVRAPHLSNAILTIQGLNGLSFKGLMSKMCWLKLAYRTVTRSPLKLGKEMIIDTFAIVRAMTRLPRAYLSGE